MTDTIFNEEWWYHAATNGAWRKAEFDDRNVLSASLIYSVYRAGGMTTVGMPRLARVMQPTIKFHSVEAKLNLSGVIRALQGLHEQLPKFDIFSYTLPPQSNLDLPFSLAGFTVTTNFTFRTTLDPTHDPWQEMEKKVRYNITSGLRRLEVVEHCNVERYISLSRKFVSDRSFKDTVDYGAVRRILNAAFARGQAVILSCVDGEGRDVASSVLLMDSGSLYYWLHSRNPEINDAAANSILIWKAISRAQSMGLIFDMDGFANANAGVFLARFGLRPERRSQISMTTDTAAIRVAAYAQLRGLVGPKLRQQLISIRNRLAGRSIVQPKGTFKLEG